MEKQRSRSSRRSSSIREMAARMGRVSDAKVMSKNASKRFVSPRDLIHNAYNESRLHPSNKSDQMRLPSRLPSGKPTFIQQNAEMSFVSEISSNSSSEDESFMSNGDEEIEEEENINEVYLEKADRSMGEDSFVSTVDHSKTKASRGSDTSMERDQSKGSKTVSEFASILADFVPRASSASYDEYSISGMTAKIYDGHLTQQIEELQGNISSKLESAMSCTPHSGAAIGERISTGYEYLKANTCGQNPFDSTKIDHGPTDEPPDEEDPRAILPPNLVNPTRSWALNVAPHQISRIWTYTNGPSNNEESDDEHMSLKSDPLPRREDDIQSLLDMADSGDDEDQVHKGRDVDGLEPDGMEPHSGDETLPGDLALSENENAVSVGPEKLSGQPESYQSKKPDDDNAERNENNHIDFRKTENVPEMSLGQATASHDKNAPENLKDVVAEQTLDSTETRLKHIPAKGDDNHCEKTDSKTIHAVKAEKKLVSSLERVPNEMKVSVDVRKPEKSKHIRAGKRWNMTRLKMWKRKFFAKEAK